MSDSRTCNRKQVVSTLSILLMLLQIPVVYSQVLFPGRQTGVTTIDGEGRSLYIGGAELQKQTSEYPHDDFVAYQFTTATPHQNAIDRSFDLRLVQIDLLAQRKLHTLFKGICRLPKPSLSVRQDDTDKSVSKSKKAESHVTTIYEKGEILTVPGTTISHPFADSESSDVSIQFTSTPLTTEQLNQGFELKSVKIELLANRKRITVFDGLVQAAVPQAPEVQDQDPAPGDEDRVRANAALNRIAGQDRTVIKTPSASLNQNFPNVSDDSLYYNLFHDQNLAKDIDLIPEQQREIDVKIKALLEKLNPLRARFEESQFAEEREELTSRATALISDFDKDYQKIVSPQLNLINQRLLSMHLKRDGFFQLAVNSGLYTQLDLADSQRAELFQLTSKMTKEIEKQFEQMHRDALVKIEQGFSADQRQKILDLTGAKELKELLPPNLPQLYYQIFRAQQQLSQDEELQKKLKSGPR